MEKQKLIYVESKALFSPSSVSNKAIVFIKDTKEIWTHGTYFICSNIWATPITLTLSGDSTGSASIDGSGNVTLLVKNNFLTGKYSYSDANNAVEPSNDKLSYYDTVLKGAANLFPSVNNANAILTLNTHDYTYNHQLGFSSNRGIYHRTRNGGVWETSWRELLTSTNYTKYPHTFASLTNKPTTISGYGITDSIPIIKGGEVTSSTDLSTLGMTTAGYKFSVSYGYESYPSWLMAYTNVLMFRANSDSYGAIGIEMMGDHRVLFMGGRNAETSKNNVPNWWFRIKGNSSATYDLNSFLNILNNLDSNYLRKSGGIMTGLILMTRGASYLTDTGSGYSMLGMINSGTSTTGMNSEEGMFINVPFTLATLRTSGNNLWHYNHANSARYLILDANNYTNYTINYANSNINTYGSVGVIANGKLYYNNAISFAMYAPDDNGGKVSYELIAELPNYGTGTNTSYVDYGISGFIWSRRGGNCHNSSAYPITAVVSIGPSTSSKLRVPVTTHVLIPFIVKYNDVYYLALRKNNSGAYFYFMGQKYNLLTTTIRINDTSLIEEIKGPEVETSTSKYYYNNGTPQEYLHAGNYSSYVLPLTGGALTGNITVPSAFINTGDATLKFYSGKVTDAKSDGNICLLTSIDGTDGQTNTYPTLYGSRCNLVLLPRGGQVYIGANPDGGNTSYKLYVNGNIYASSLNTGGTSSQFLKADGSLDSTAYLPLSGGTMTGALNFKNNTWNLVGDDVYMGDCNIGGMLGIKSAYSSSNPGFAFYNLGGTQLGKLYADNSKNLYWTDNLLVTASNVNSFLYEANLKLGGRNIANGYSPIDASMIGQLGANRLAFINSPISIEYSRDSGNTWADYPNLSNSQKVGFVSGCGLNLWIGADGSTNTSVDRLGYQLRVTLTASNSNLYTELTKFAIYIVSNGCACFCKVETRTLENINNGVDTWSLLTNTQISGYPAWNIINTWSIFGTGNTKHGLIRFTFYITAQSSTSGRGLNIHHLLGFGGMGWLTPSNMSRIGHIYSYDGALNTTFPAKVTASSFSGPLTGNVTGNVTGTATSANKANLLASLDLRNNYPALIVTAGETIGASFMTASKLGISGDGSYYDALIIRGYRDSTGGNENAIMFGKNTSSVYHSLYAFGSTTTWGTLYKFLDSGNYKNYAPTLSGEGATGTWGISISGTANKVANALTLLLNGGTTSGTNKFVYDGSAAYTVNITPEAIGASATNHTHSYLPLSGGTLGNTSATETELRLKSSTATLRLVAYLNTFNYIQSGNADFNGSTPLQITGYNGTVGSDLYLKFTNIYCRSGNYTNIDSGNYSSYALPLSGGTLTGTLISRDIRPSANLSYSLGTSSYYYNYVYANYFKKNGSSDSYVLLGGGGHKAVSDFAPNNVATLSSSGMGNSDLWTLVFEKSYPANYWYAPTTMFYIRSGTAGCGILCFYNYWASGTQLDDYEREVWFFGALKSETGITFGGANRDINDFFRIYIDKANFKYCIYYNRYNDLSLKILELLFFTVPEPGEYLSTGSLRSSFFTNSTTVVDLPTESSTLVRVPIKTTYNHDRTIRTSKSIYASSFYENSDIRLKENVRGIDLSDLTKLVDLVQFNFKDSGTKKYGVIAQLLELVGLQNLVYENNGNKAVDYISLLVLETLRLRNEIKELKEKLDKKELSS